MPNPRHRPPAPLPDHHPEIEGPGLTAQLDTAFPMSERDFLANYTPWTPKDGRGGDRREARHDGWTPDKQRLFLCTLRYRRSVKLSANAVGLSRENAYQLRRKWKPFAAHWDRALSTEACTVADLMLRRAVEGFDVPVVAKSGKVRWKRVVPADPGVWLLEQLLVAAPQGPRLAGGVFGPEDWDGTGLVAALVGAGRAEW
jgi:hypothetical protein